jgi:folate-binding protein YgfZ
MPSALQPETASPTTQLDALLHHAAIAPLSDIGWIRVTGADRVRWLNGMVTNAIQSLAPGQGNYNFALNAQGRIQADLTAFALEDQILLETTHDQIGPLLTHLDHFIIMDDVELGPISGERWGIVIAGPQAAELLQRIGIPTAQAAPLTLQTTTWKRNRLDLIHAHSPLVPRFEIWSDLTTVLEITQALTPAGATPVTPEALEHLRLLSGTPRYGTDIRNTATAHDLPQETAQTRALHFSKGCYLGQEIVERINSRGNVHRTFSGFSLTGTLPTPGTALTAEGKPVGELTSVAAIPLPQSPVQLALGYIRREALDRGTQITYPGGTATPSALPFQLPESRA